MTDLSDKQRKAMWARIKQGSFNRIPIEIKTRKGGTSFDYTNKNAKKLTTELQKHIGEPMVLWGGGGFAGDFQVVKLLKAKSVTPTNTDSNPEDHKSVQVKLETTNIGRQSGFGELKKGEIIDRNIASWQIDVLHDGQPQEQKPSKEEKDFSQGIKRLIENPKFKKVDPNNVWGKIKDDIDIPTYSVKEIKPELQSGAKEGQFKIGNSFYGEDRLQEIAIDARNSKLITFGTTQKLFNETTFKTSSLPDKPAILKIANTSYIIAPVVKA